MVRDGSVYAGSLPVHRGTDAIGIVFLRPGHIDPAVAERGFYGFDASPLGGAFGRVAVPMHPVRVVDLPAPVAAIMVVFRGVSLARAEIIKEPASPHDA